VGIYFRVERVHNGKQARDYGVSISFDQTSCAISWAANLIQEQLGYVNTIQDVIELDYRSFQCVFFKYKWFNIFDRMTSIRYGLNSDLYSIDMHREISSSHTKSFVPPKHYEYIFFYSNVFGGFLFHLYLVGKGFLKMILLKLLHQVEKRMM
jgi:hypothetical protein